jgi:hypothetical protein
VVDAAGSIYVIGGGSDGKPFLPDADVWASTDGGARPDNVGGTRGYVGVLQGF